MKKFSLATLVFVMFAMIFVISCEDKDSNNTTEEATCTPACVEGTECKCADNECKCEMIIVEECKCEDGTACPEGGKDACETHKPKTCDPACNEETQDCLCDEEKCECRDKDVKPECKCEDGTDCPEGDAAKCAVPVVEDPCKDKTAGDECAENKVCTAAEDGKLACMDKAEEKPEPKCADDCNLETHDCVCEADKCECKEKAAEECFCDEEKKVACPEGGKDACEKADPEQAKCDPACKDTEECVCSEPNEEGATECKCEEKKADPEPVE